jgi:integrase
MRVYKSTYTDVGGKRREPPKWYVEFRDHMETIRRLAAFTHLDQSEELGRKLVRLAGYRISGEQPDPVIARWIETIPPRMRSKLMSWGLLDARQVAAGRSLAEHLVDFETALKAKGNTTAYVKMMVARVRRVTTGCGFKYWSDISASRVQAFLAELRTGTKAGERGISAQTHNFYLAAFKGFCRWMHRDRRAAESPAEHLQGINVRTDRRHDRRALAIEEMIWLLDTTASGPDRGKVSGADRSLLYRFAAETGLRSSELRSLTVSSFNLGSKPPRVKLAAGYSKHRKEDVQILKQDTAAVLKQHLANKLPSTPALRMPSKVYLPRVLRKDLAAARERWLTTAPDAATRAEMEATDFLCYTDHAGRFADFHAFRHVTGSFLAAAGVSPKVAQSLMRHSDYKLTMNTYSHAFREDESDAIERLPDLSRRPKMPKKGDGGSQKNSA